MSSPAQRLGELMLKMVIPPKEMYRSNTIPIKMLMSISAELKKELKIHIEWLDAYS